MNTGKNETRIASLMGTWTSTMQVKASIGNYKLLTYFVVHLMPNPMREYGCTRNDCLELDNQVCIQQNNGNHAANKCVNMTDQVVDWSDVSAFIYFGAKVDAGIPFNVHKEKNTGGWVGPLSMIMAKNTTLEESDNSTKVLDRYVVRYVQSPSTPYLQMNPDCSLLSAQDFERYMGSTAVNETVHAQANMTAGGDDPYGQYLNTCDNGNVKPILPLYEFTFVQNEETGKEEVQVKLDYKVLTIPHKTDIMYKVFPWMQKRVNKRHKGFHISGPYCYDDDPKRGYTFDLNYDSAHEAPFLSLIHGCAKGLPCLPSAARLSVEGAADRIIHNSTKIDTVDVGPEVYLSFAVYLLLLALLVCATCNRRMSRRLARLERESGGDRSPSSRPRGGIHLPSSSRDPGPFGDLGQEETKEDLSEPLLSTEKEPKTANGDLGETGPANTSARVEFV